MNRALPWICFVVVALGGIMPLESRGDDDEENRRPSKAAKYIDPDPATGSSAAVIVDDVPLIYTGMYLAYTQMPDNSLIVKGDAKEQFDQLQSTLQASLGGRSRSGLHRLVKVNYYAATSDAAEVVVRELARRECGPAPCPAISVVVGKLEHPDALVGLDCVALTAEKSVRSVGRDSAFRNKPTRSFIATMPAGRRIYISGQAEPSKDMAEATRLTLASLEKTLKHLGRGWDDVVQIKSFLGPMTEVAAAEREIMKVFGDRPTPALVFVEWKSSLPIEIEMVVWGGPRPENEPVQDPVEYITPPEMTASPVFCRVTRVSAPETIFISGLYGNNTEGNAAAETSAIFESLGKILDKTGSDFRHLAKATYYVSTDEASTKLNEIRPRFYDPKRPPAASKAVVPGTGRPGRTLTLDMIAVKKGGK